MPTRDRSVQRLHPRGRQKAALRRGDARTALLGPTASTTVSNQTPGSLIPVAPPPSAVGLRRRSGRAPERGGHQVPSDWTAAKFQRAPPHLKGGVAARVGGKRSPAQPCARRREVVGGGGGGGRRERDGIGGGGEKGEGEATRRRGRDAGRLGD